MYTKQNRVGDIPAFLWNLRAGVGRPCVETELTATKKSATDGN